MRYALTALCVFMLAGSAHAAQTRVIGGAPAGTWPALSPLIASGYSAVNGHFCGGTLIAPQRVLTAAHCVVDGGTGIVSSPASIKVAPGARVLSEVPDAAQIGVTRIDVHPSYDRVTYDFDAAVLHLSAPSPSLPASLPAAGEVASDGMATMVAGWGTMTYGMPDYADVAMDVDAPVLADADCAGYGSGYDPAHMICAGTTAGGKDACQGDSGGPLAVGPERRVVGIVSWGYGCALAGYPGIYTRVSAVRNWVTAAAEITPGAPRGLTQVRLDPSAVRLSWDAPIEYAWALDGYRVWINGAPLADLPVAARTVDVPLGADALIEVAGISAAGPGARAALAPPVDAPIATITPIAPVTSSAPALISRPQLRGRPRVGARLIATRGVWSGEGVATRVRFQRATRMRGPWRAVARDGVTYRLRASDRGKYIRARITATGPGGATVSLTPVRRVR